MRGNFYRLLKRAFGENHSKEKCVIWLMLSGIRGATVCSFVLATADDAYDYEYNRAYDFIQRITPINPQETTRALYSTDYRVWSVAAYAAFGPFIENGLLHLLVKLKSKISPAGVFLMQSALSGIFSYLQYDVFKAIKRYSDVAGGEAAVADWNNGVRATNIPHRPWPEYDYIPLVLTTVPFFLVVASTHDRVYLCSRLHRRHHREGQRLLEQGDDRTISRDDNEDNDETPSSDPSGIPASQA